MKRSCPTEPGAAAVHGTLRNHGSTVAAVLALGLILSGSALSVQASQESPQQPLPSPGAPPTLADEEPELVETRVRGKVRGVLEVRRGGGEIYLPLEDVAGLLELELNQDGEIITLITPLGDAQLTRDQLRFVDDRAYVAASEIARELNSKFIFDERTYSMEIEPLWHPERRRPSLHSTLDVRAPSATLSGIRATFDHVRQDGLKSNAGSLQMVGRLARGTWYVSAQDATAQIYNFNEYYWHTRRKKMAYLAGRTGLRFVNSLGNFELAGLQVGWSNRERRPVPGVASNGRLFPRRAAPVESLYGEAPPGNFVQVRIDGRIVGMQQVGFNGKYEFQNVPLPTRQSTGVEILVFEPSNLRIPVEIRRDRMAASAYMVPDGTLSHTGGIGLAGRFTKRIADGEAGDQNGLGGFYMWRQGLSRNLTGEAIVQANGRNVQSYFGAIGRLSEVWVVGGGLAYTPGAVGYQINAEGFLPRWAFLFDSRVTPGEFGLTESPDVTDHRFEVRHNTLQSLRTGLVARYLDDQFHETQYVLPTATWRPGSTLYFDARPDFDGRYQFNAAWQIDARSQMRYFRSRNSNLELTRKIGRKWEIGYGSLFENVEPRFSLFANLRQYALGGMWYLGASVVRSEGRFGYSARASAPVVAGVFARLEYQSIPVIRFDGPDDSGRFVLNLVSDFSQSGGRIVPARSGSFRNEQGGVVGRIVLDPESRELAGVKASDFNLKGIRVYVTDHGSAITDSGGHFFIGRMQPGLHEVELDTTGLPIELSPERTRVIAEVAPSAATRVDFFVRLELGVAGRVVDVTGRPMVAATVIIVAEDGAVVARGATDTFGLYRLDAIPPGRYTLQVLDQERLIGSREVLVQGDYVFNQNVEVPAPPSPGMQAGLAPDW